MGRKPKYTPTQRKYKKYKIIEKNAFIFGNL